MMIAEKDESQGVKETHFILQVCGILPSCCFIGLGIFLLGLDADLAITGVFIVLGLNVMQSLYATSELAAQKKMHFARLGLIDFLSVLASVIVLAICLYNGLEVMSLIFADVSETVIKTLLLWIVEPVRLSGTSFTNPMTIYDLLRPYWKESILIQWVNCLTNHLDVIFLSFLVPIQQVGIYDRFQKLARIPNSASINLIDKVSLIKFSIHSRSLGEVKRLLIRDCIILALLLILVVGSLSCILPLVLYPINHQWYQDLWPLWISGMLIFLIQPFNWLFNYMYQGTGRISVLLNVTVLYFIIKLVGFIILVPILGVYGLIISISLAAICQLGYQIYNLMKCKNTDALSI